MGADAHVTAEPSAPEQVLRGLPIRSAKFEGEYALEAGQLGMPEAGKVRDVLRGPWRAPVGEERLAVAPPGPAETVAEQPAEQPPPAAAPTPEEAETPAPAMGSDSAEEGSAGSLEGTPLPGDFPGRKQLEKAGIVTLEKVRAIPPDALPKLPGITQAMAGKVLQALEKLAATAA